MRKAKVISVEPPKHCANCGGKKESLKLYYCDKCKGVLLQMKLREDFNE
ncbi:hypothetical protein PUS82_00425 [Cytobacillus firmus]|nr:hypothetical protein [Cytobacillus firmus]MDD9309796.1 hypothetical protein [Cytobacillus firmus]